MPTFERVVEPVKEPNKTQKEGNKSNRPSFVCKICKFVLKSKSGNYKRHMKLHDQEKTFWQCILCKKDFSTLSNFNAHKNAKIHMNEPNKSAIQYKIIKRIDTKQRPIYNSQM